MNFAINTETQIITKIMYDYAISDIKEFEYRFELDKYRK